MSRRDEILTRAREIPAMPVSLAKALALLGDPLADMREIIGVIEYDPGATANILRAANSPAFQSGAGVNTIFEAVTRLGSRNIMEILVSSRMPDCLAGAVKGYDLPPGELWRSSVWAALCAEELNMELHLGLPSYVFTAALLRDTGKTALGALMGIDAAEILELSEKRGLSFSEAERLVLGIDHAETGAALLGAWGLTDEIVVPARCHHEPEKAPPPWRQATDTVHIADALALMGGLGTGADGLSYRISGEAAENLRLSAAVVETVIMRTQIKYDGLRPLFESGASPPEKKGEI
jgi:HD-like signal output (HDOD) protein